MRNFYRSAIGIIFLLFGLGQGGHAQVSADSIAESKPRIHDQLFNTLDDVLNWMSTDSWSFIPAVSYSPETSLGLGMGAIKVFRNSKSISQNLRPSSMPITFLYTLEKQAILEADVDLWRNYNKDYFYARLEMAKYPLKFYGIGNDLPSSNEEDYASRYLLFKFNYLRLVLPHLYFGPQLDFRTDNVYQKEEGGLLDSGDIPGSDKPLVAGLGLKVSHDTRSDIFQPRRGALRQFSWMSYQSFWGSDYTYNKYELDLRQYVPVGTASVLAFQAFGSVVDGLAPFQQLSLLGGSKRMRGYYEGRYREQTSMIYQGEYRFPVYRDLGMVLFGNTGQVESGLNQFSWDGFHAAFGFGFRYKLLDEGVNIRIDFGFGNQSAFYFGLNEVY
ncbi:membrane protein [Echinicola pacifica]|uniref:Membrane protein n=1 Tax=Echinicola pacifica TaxID=346377 RepID=A0A918ULP0_9BACT|nr:BamA/TamA family outer membrane protein [Echinicola pacifica]GGZ20789.1 membrane protein [Echinicola pacifica]